MGSSRQRTHRSSAWAPSWWVLCAGGYLLAVVGHVAAVEYRLLPNVQKVRKHGYSSLAYAPDGRFIAAAGGSPIDASDPGKLTIWDVDSGEIVLHRQDFPSLCRVVRFSPDGRTLAVVAGDRAVGRLFVYTLRLTLAGKRPVWGDPVRLPWPAPSGPSRIDRYPSLYTGDVCFSPSGRSLVHLHTLYGAGRERMLLNINLWSEGGESRRIELPGTDHSSLVRFLDEDRLIVDSWRDRLSTFPMHVLQVIDLTTGTVQREVAFETDREGAHQTDGLELSADRNWIAYSYHEGVRILRTDNLEVVRNIETGRHGSMSFSPHGEVLATAVTTKVSSVRFFDVRTGEELAARSHERSFSTDIEFSPDGRYLATLDLDGGIRLWDMQQILPGLSLAPGDQRE